ncbi:MAG: hypothetical protein WBB74_11480 [Gaiellaceae bacterium]
MVGRTPSVLVARLAAAAAIGTGLGVYYATHESLPDVSNWGDVAVISLGLIPAVFALVYLVLPFWRAPVLQLFLVGGALIVLAVVLGLAGLDTASDFAKLGATTAIAFWFLNFFEAMSWVVIVALIVPWVDAYSVWRGPTSNIVHHHGHVFNWLSFAFPLPGENNDAQLGVPDLLFFALFLASTARFALRTRLTWLALTLSFGGTIAIAVAWDQPGLPALPLLSLGFLVTNADLLYRRLRPERT